LFCALHGAHTANPSQNEPNPKRSCETVPVALYRKKDIDDPPSTRFLLPKRALIYQETQPIKALLSLISCESGRSSPPQEAKRHVFALVNEFTGISNSNSMKGRVLNQSADLQVREDDLARIRLRKTRQASSRNPDSVACELLVGTTIEKFMLIGIGVGELDGDRLERKE
jgi:hypothetical protein